MITRSSLFLSFNVPLTLQGSVPATQKTIMNSIFHDSAQYEKSNGVGGLVANHSRPMNVIKTTNPPIRDRSRLNLALALAPFWRRWFDQVDCGTVGLGGNLRVVGSSPTGGNERSRFSMDN
jgi:hypothetical protein